MQKLPKQAYTAEVKEQAAKRVKDGRGLGAVAKEMGLDGSALIGRMAVRLSLIYQHVSKYAPCALGHYRFAQGTSLLLSIKTIFIIANGP